MLRKCDRPLQKIVSRVTELETSIKKQDNGVKRSIFPKWHFGGPLVPGIKLQNQFKELKFNDCILNCFVPDSWVYLNDSSVVVISKFLRTDGNHFIIGKRFRKKKNLYDYPISSSALHIFCVSDLSDANESWSIDSIKWKAVKISLSTKSNDFFAVSPFLMKCHNYFFH